MSFKSTSIAFGLGILATLGAQAFSASPTGQASLPIVACSLDVMSATNRMACRNSAMAEADRAKTKMSVIGQAVVDATIWEAQQLNRFDGWLTEKGGAASATVDQKASAFGDWAAQKQAEVDRLMAEQKAKIAAPRTGQEQPKN